MPYATHWMASLVLVSGAAALMDVRERRVPNALVVFLAVLGAIAQAVTGGPFALASGVLAAALTMALLWIPWRARGIGGGDVKLATGVALWMGLPVLPYFAAAVALCGGAVSLLHLAIAAPQTRRRVVLGLAGSALRRELPRPADAARIRVPYALAIFLGTVVVLWMRSAA